MIVAQNKGIINEIRLKFANLFWSHESTWHKNTLSTDDMKTHGKFKCLKSHYHYWYFTTCQLCSSGIIP